MKLTSRAFGHRKSIPVKFTCQGENVSPELTIQAVPMGARSLALTMDDPDAPGKTFDHWVLYDIAPETVTIAEGDSPGTSGVNDFGDTGYGGPCPPSGIHRYRFKAYALDKRLELPEGARKDDLEKQMAGHILAESELIGRYSKSWA
ncbi:MAG TPA: YbhB/YbcL family Raf kinase inhibitor-like protein [Desulfosarcina sp.]|nr:YbhB/YbcL family Raf kinase inhibitor-like protein [Desulfosarcina sp.]